MNKLFFLVLSLFLCFFIVTSSFATTSKLTWNDITFNYASDWQIKKSKIEGKDSLEFISQYISLRFVFMNLPEIDAKTKELKEKMPVKFSEAMCVPMALAIAQKKQENVSFSHGYIQFANHPAPSTRAVIINPDTINTATAECFTTFPSPQKMLGGIILIKGQRGKIIEKPSYHQKIKEAYEIASNISY